MNHDTCTERTTSHSRNNYSTESSISSQFCKIVDLLDNSPCTHAPCQPRSDHALSESSGRHHSLAATRHFDQGDQLRKQSGTCKDALGPKNQQKRHVIRLANHFNLRV